jgi:hypothetical protein
MKTGGEGEQVGFTVEVAGIEHHANDLHPLLPAGSLFYVLIIDEFVRLQ